MAANVQERVQPHWRRNRGAWFAQDDVIRHFEMKRAAIEQILGPMGPRLARGAANFAQAGGVDLYPFAQALPGTAFATMDLIAPDGSGPRRNRFGAYELVAFTRLSPEPSPTPLFARASEHSRTPYELMVERIARMLNAVTRECFLEVIEPGDTDLLPAGQNDQMAVLFDRYDTAVPLQIGKKKHHLLLCMEIFPSELEYARLGRASHLVRLLQLAGHYPYSDLDRKPVV